MTAYQTLYESLLRIVYAPVCTAYHLIDPKRFDDDFKLDNGGRARLKAIRSIERNSAYRFDSYQLGLDHTLRNATAHRHYEIFDHEEYVEYWDGTNPRSRITESEMRDLCRDAFYNASAILDAIILWFVNHRSVAEKRGWLKENKPRRVSRLEFEKAITAMFEAYSLTVLTVERTDESERICLGTRSRGVDQTSTIFRGGDGWSESFDVEIKYEEIPILPEILDILRHVVRGYKTAKKIEVEICDSDGAPLGEISVKAGVVRRLKDPEKQPVDNVRKSFDADTLGDAEMWREFRSMPTRATPRLNTRNDDD
jgi:hypothetical protein